MSVGRVDFAAVEGGEEGSPVGEVAIVLREAVAAAERGAGAVHASASCQFQFGHYLPLILSVNAEVVQRQVCGIRIGNACWNSLPPPNCELGVSSPPCAISFRLKTASSGKDCSSCASKSSTSSRRKLTPNLRLCLPRVQLKSSSIWYCVTFFPEVRRRESQCWLDRDFALFRFHPRRSRSPRRREARLGGCNILRPEEGSVPVSCEHHRVNQIWRDGVAVVQLPFVFPAGLRGH